MGFGNARESPPRRNVRERTTRMRADHVQCATLPALLRGSLYECLTTRPGRRVRPGALVYAMGDLAQSIYFVRHGLVKSSVVSPAGEELILRMHHAGDILGELCLCTGRRREQAMALEASDVVELLLGDLLARLRRSPEEMLEFATTVCDHVGGAYEKLRSLSFDPAMGRLARELLNLANVLGEPASRGTRIAHYIKQADLARLVGVRREVASGLLNRLRERQLIGYSRKSRIWVDCDGLQCLADAIAPE